MFETLILGDFKPVASILLGYKVYGLIEKAGLLVLWRDSSLMLVMSAYSRAVFFLLSISVLLRATPVIKNSKTTLLT